MLALPDDPGVVGALLLAFGVVLGTVLGLTVQRRLGALPFPALPAVRPVTVALAIAFGCAWGIAPFVSWRIVQDLRTTTAIPAEVAERIGAFERDLDGRAFDRVAAIVPPGDTYYLAVDRDEFGGRDFGSWSRVWLLPRIAVGSPGQADWVLAYGVDPRTLGVPVSEVREIPTSYGEGAPPTYLARVGR